MHHAPSVPQDVRASPDGSLFYVADMMADGVHVVDGASLTQVGFIPTGVGAHGLIPAGTGSCSMWPTVAATQRAGQAPRPGQRVGRRLREPEVLRAWPVPGGGSPDMGNVSADGRHLWLSGRFDNVVYRFGGQRYGRRHQGRPGTSRPDCLAATRPLLARSHRQPALKAQRCACGLQQAAYPPAWCGRHHGLLDGCGVRGVVVARWPAFQRGLTQQGNGAGGGVAALHDARDQPASTPSLITSVEHRRAVLPFGGADEYR